MGKVISPIHTPAQIRDHFSYDPITGALCRLIGYGKQHVGVPVESDKVQFLGREYIVPRVCWCIFYGEWPPDDMYVDHRNRRHGINSIDNLRLATPTQNQQNKAASGRYPKGVVWRNRPRPWAARIRINGERVCLGNFKTMVAAMIAYREACVEHHGEFACYE